MAHYRSVKNEVTGEFELVTEEDYQKNMSKSTKIITRDYTKSLCNNMDCSLVTFHKQDGVKECKMKAPNTQGSFSNSSDWRSRFPTAPVTWKEKCRHEPTACFNVVADDVIYHGGSDSKVTPEDFDGLVVCLLGRDKYLTPPTPIVPPTKVKGKGDWAALAAFEKKAAPWTPKDVKDYLTIDWPDYGIPPVGVDFWKNLHALVVEKKLKKVLFFCIGGHGRTGTALASMLITVCGLNNKEATKWVHKNYCEEAIESSTQEAYLKELSEIVAKGNAVPNGK